MRWLCLLVLVAWGVAAGSASACPPSNLPPSDRRAVDQITVLLESASDVPALQADIRLTHLDAGLGLGSSVEGTILLSSESERFRFVGGRPDLVAPRPGSLPLALDHLLPVPKYAMYGLDPQRMRLYSAFDGAILFEGPTRRLYLDSTGTKVQSIVDRDVTVLYSEFIRFHGLPIATRVEAWRGAHLLLQARIKDIREWHSPARTNGAPDPGPRQVFQVQALPGLLGPLPGVRDVEQSIAPLHARP